MDLKGFFNRLDQFETALQENIDKQKETLKMVLIKMK